MRLLNTNVRSLWTRTLAIAVASLGDTYFALGQYEKAIDFIDKAIRLSPRDPSLFFWYTNKGVAYFALQQDDQAIEWARRRSRSIRVSRLRTASSPQRLHYR